MLFLSEIAEVRQKGDDGHISREDGEETLGARGDSRECVLRREKEDRRRGKEKLQVKDHRSNVQRGGISLHQ